MKNNLVRKVITVGLIGALSLSALVGCSTPADEGDKEAKVDATDEGGTSGDDEGAESGLSGDLVYWSNWNETESQGLVLTEAIAAFEAANPDVNIDVVWNGRENRKLLVPGLESGQQLDMFDQAVDVVFDQLGDYLLDLTPYFAKSYPSTNGATYEESFMKSAVDVFKAKKEGGIYAVPYQPTMMTIMYNKDHFEAAGISSTPKTWEEFLDACKKLDAAGFIPLTSDDAYIGTLLGMHLERLKGEEFLSATVFDSPENWDDPAFVQAFTDFKGLVDAGYISENLITNKYPAGQQEIAMGKVTMYMNGTWLPNEVMGTTGESFNWGSFAYPVFDEAISPATNVQYNSQALGINKNTESPDAAFAFAAFITTGEWDQKLSEKTYGVPMSADAAWPAQLQDAQPILEGMEHRIQGTFGLFNNGEKTPLIVAAFLSVLSGDATPEEAIDTLK